MTGDFVRIEHKGQAWTGRVISAVNYGVPGEPNWYIEFMDPISGAHYLKQQEDGMALAVITFDTKPMRRWSTCS